MFEHGDGTGRLGAICVGPLQIVQRGESALHRLRVAEADGEALDQPANLRIGFGRQRIPNRVPILGNIDELILQRDRQTFEGAFADSSVRRFAGECEACGKIFGLARGNEATHDAGNDVVGNKGITGGVVAQPDQFRCKLIRQDRLISKPQHQRNRRIASVLLVHQQCMEEGDGVEGIPLVNYQARQFPPHLLWRLLAHMSGYDVEQPLRNTRIVRQCANGLNQSRWISSGRRIRESKEPVEPVNIAPKRINRRIDGAANPRPRDGAGERPVDPLCGSSLSKEPNGGSRAPR